MQVSHETIYLSLFVQNPGVLKRRWSCTCRAPARCAGPNSRRRRGNCAVTSSMPCRSPSDPPVSRIGPSLDIGRATCCRAPRTPIATLVERQSRFVMLVRLDGKDTTTVVRALSRAVRALPRGLMASLTWNRGGELAAHKTFTVATDVRVYFCDPQSPWQRGSNENTNGLLRQYLPHGTDLSTHSQAQLNAIARRLNTRPRKTLGYRTPADKLATSVALTP